MCKKSQSQETQKEQHCPDQGDKLGEACVLKVRLKKQILVIIEKSNYCWWLFNLLCSFLIKYVILHIYFHGECLYSSVKEE